MHYEAEKKHWCACVCVITDTDLVPGFKANRKIRSFAHYQMSFENHNLFNIFSFHPCIEMVVVVIVLPSFLQLLLTLLITCTYNIKYKFGCGSRGTGP